MEDTQLLIDLEKIHVPTLVICGGEDPYLNYDLVNASLEMLPEGSEPEIIEGRSHVVFYEEPYYRDFQERLIRFWMYRKAGMGLPLKAKDFLIVFRYPPDGPFPLSNLFISA